MTTFVQKTIATAFTALSLSGCVGAGSGANTFYKSPENDDRRGDGLSCIDKAQIGNKSGAEQAAAIDACNRLVNNHRTNPYGTRTDVINVNNAPYNGGGTGYGQYWQQGTGYAVPPPGAAPAPVIVPAPTAAPAPAAAPAPTATAAPAPAAPAP